MTEATVGNVIVPALEERGEGWLDSEDLERLYGLSRSSIRYAVRRGEVRVVYHRPTRRTLYNEEDVRAYVERKGLRSLPPAPPGDRWVPLGELIRRGVPYHKIRTAIRRKRLHPVRVSHRRTWILESEAREAGLL